MGELPNLPLCCSYVIIIISTQFFTLIWLGSAVACGEDTVARLVCACFLTPKCESLFVENVGACLAHTESLWERLVLIVSPKSSAVLTIDFFGLWEFVR